MPRASRSASQNDCENRVSRNSPNFVVALNCGIGSSCLNAEVNAFERLQKVRDRNSSSPWLEVEVMHCAS